MQVLATTTCSAAKYQAGRFVAGTATSTAFSIGPSKCSELAYAFETSNATLGATYELRVVTASTTTLLNNYMYTPTFTIESARTVTYSKEARGSFATSTLEDGTDTSNGRYNSLVIGTDGFPVISYYDDSTGSLKVSKCLDASCTGIPTITTLENGTNSSNGQYISLAIGTDGYPIISYSDYISGSLKVAKCLNASCAGVPTITTLENSTDSSNGWYTSIAIGTDGYPVISYMDWNTGSLKVAKCIDASCLGVPTITTLENGTDFSNGYYTSIAIGPDGYPIISYMDWNSGSLKVAKCLDASCAGAPTITTLENGTDTSNGRYTSIAIGTDGFPVINYTDYTAGSLKVAKCLNISCAGVPTITTLETGTASSNGRFASLVIGIDDYPVISYSDYISGSLKVAKCLNASCAGVPTITTVDVGTASSNGWNSLAIGADGYPVISYYDENAGLLKVAKCYNGSCSSGTVDANFTGTGTSYANYLDDAGYNNVASSDNLYDSLTAATSSRLAFNFKKASTTNTDQITVTWEGQVSVSTTTSLQIYKNDGSWTTLATSLNPTQGSDFVLSGSQSSALSSYYDGSNMVTVRVITGTTTNITTLKTDYINISFSTAGSLTLTVSTDNFGNLTPNIYKYATSTLSVTTNNISGYYMTLYGNNQGSLAASTTMYYAATPYSPNITDQTEWVPGGGINAATTTSGNAVVRTSLDSSGQVLAFRVMTASGSIPFTSTAWWGTSDADGVAKWAGIASSTIPRMIGNSSSAVPSGALNTVQYYLNVPITQPSGNYTGNITCTATMNL
jgi:hypothetical protein